MRQTTRITGRAMPVDRANVDTDQIIPAHWLKNVGRTGYGAGLFEAWRKDPSFVINDPRYKGATILVAGPNFGSGSSREHAVWALDEYGFRAVISSKLADIFKGNSLKMGLVPVELPAEVVTKLLRAVEKDPSLEITIDVERATVEAPAIGVRETLRLDEFTRTRLREGLDDIALTLRYSDDIARFEAKRPGWLPRVS